MRKYLILLFILCFTFVNCEKDDICIDTTTPKLIIVFYNDTIPGVKKTVTSLTVWAEDNENIYENKSLDSIAIPLDLNQNRTTYILDNKTSKDTIAFTYDRKDIFVSRSCGYKTTFENLQIESRSANWIKNDTIKNTTIDNETAVHLTIFH
jgi:antitoxin component YwqK of YwqJK toxin-antitoxin module